MSRVGPRGMLLERIIREVVYYIVLGVFVYYMYHEDYPSALTTLGIYSFGRTIV